MIKKFYDLKILTKIVVLFTAIVIMTGINAFLAYQNLNKEENVINYLGKNVLPSIQSLITLYQAETSALSAERGVLNRDLKDKSIRESIYNSINSAFERADKAWNIYDNLDKTEEQANIWAQFKEDWKEWKSIHQQVIENQRKIDQLIPEENNEQIEELVLQNNLLSVKALEKFDAAKVHLKKLVELYDSEAENFNNTTLAQVEESKSITILIIIITVIVMLFFIPLITKVIVKPINKLANKASEILKGNFNIEFENTDWKDEVGNLNRSFAEMITKIKNEIAHFKSFQNGVSSAFFTINNDLTITYINQAALDIINSPYKPEEIINKMRVKEVFGTDSISRRAVEGKFLKGDKAFIKNNKGDEIPILAQSGPIKNSKGEMDGAFVFFTDMREIEEKNEAYLKEQIAPIASVIREIADGKLTHKLDIDPKSVLYDLGNDINRMIEELKEILIKVREVVNATASAAIQISSSTEEMAAGAQEQNQQVNEITYSIEKMTKSILDMSDNLTEVAEMSKQSSQAAELGTNKTANTKKGMDKIVESSDKAASIIATLANKTDQIGEITSVIDEIADQTNLLALNAAIEAARAGEQGRGFAVVADEVRKLAERTTKATKEIADTIKSIQLEVREADKSMANAKISVEEGKRLTDEIDNVLKEIYKSARNVSDLIDSIVSASQEQSISAEEISKSIENITTVTQQAASSTSQIAHSTNNLTQLTESLQELIERFQLDLNDGNKILSKKRMALSEMN
ncbi:methyl-accepting chemotaxis protein [Melioribacter sp. OK-6-Me]|uniref:methyl-accepting chemotaxis protein n=1 Tax=unclassified Melioribacter TaxID=2627329 RepID=UPI003EDAF6ED